MSNTYFKLKTIDTYKGNEKLKFKPYETKMEISLTAFIGNTKLVQLTTRTESTIPSQNGISYITLSREDCDRLIKALQERLNGEISATGSEISKYTDDPEDEALG